MNISDVFVIGVHPKIALTTNNIANEVQHHLKTAGLDVLAGMPRVFITGSRVWRTVLGLPLDPAADVDIMLIGDEDEARTARGGVIGLLQLSSGVISTGPSMSEDRDQATLEGIKYLTPGGLTVDIWGMADVHIALQQYPEHSHASSRMAWDCEHGCLLVFPNPLATS